SFMPLRRSSNSQVTLYLAAIFCSTSPDCTECVPPNSSSANRLELKTTVWLMSAIVFLAEAESAALRRLPRRASLRIRRAPSRSPASFLDCALVIGSVFEDDGGGAISEISEGLVAGSVMAISTDGGELTIGWLTEFAGVAGGVAVEAMGVATGCRGSITG